MIRLPQFFSLNIFLLEKLQANCLVKVFFIFNSAAQEELIFSVAFKMLH
jgi:hypothetical protein